MTHPLLWLGLLAGGAYLYTKSSSSSSSSGSLSQQSSAATQLANLQANQGTADAAAQFNAQAQALGLTQTQAQEAYDTGLSPSEYAQGVLGQTASTSGMVGAPLLAYYADDPAWWQNPYG
jgi:hypothetical protein